MTYQKGLKLYACSKCGLQKRYGFLVMGGQLRSCPTDYCTGAMHRVDGIADRRAEKAKRELAEQSGDTKVC